MSGRSLDVTVGYILFRVENIYLVCTRVQVLASKWAGMKVRICVRSERVERTVSTFTPNRENDKHYDTINLTSLWMNRVLSRAVILLIYTKRY